MRSNACQLYIESAVALSDIVIFDLSSNFFERMKDAFQISFSLLRGADK